MENENLTEENMSTAVAKTSSLLLSVIKSTGNKMIDENLDELRFNVPNTRVSLMLVRDGSDAYRSRELDRGAMLGVGYEISGIKFILARR